MAEKTQHRALVPFGTTVVTLIAVAALIALVGPPSGPRPAALSPLMEGPSTSAPAQSEPSANGNFTIFQAEPAAPAVPGSLVLAQFTVTVVTSPANATPLEVWVPQTLVTFYGSNASTRIFHNPVSFLYLPAGSQVSNATNLTVLLTFSGAFNQSELAFLSSQSAALMSNRPYGSVTVSVSWRWLLADPDGSVVAGPWSRGTLIQPAYIAQLSSYGPTTLNPGGSFSVCLSGPTSGRTFSLHLEIPKPFFDFAQANLTVPEDTVAPVCLSAIVPTWVQPQPILARVWDYDQVTLLLYTVKVTVTNVTSPLSTFIGAVSSVGGAVTLTSLVIGGIVIAVSLVQRRRRRVASIPPAQEDSR